MQYFKKILFTMFIVLNLTSCTSINNFSLNNDNSTKYTNFKSITSELITPICSHIKNDRIIYIADFVNERNLKNKSQLGFLLSNESKVNILNSDCTSNLKIQDLQLSKQLKISPNGSRILTRNIDELKINNLHDNKKIIVGSYIITNNQILVFTKLMDLKTGQTIATTSASTQINDEILSLEGIVSNKQKEAMQEDKTYNQTRKHFHL